MPAIMMTGLTLLVTSVIFLVVGSGSDAAHMQVISPQRSFRFVTQAPYSSRLRRANVAVTHEFSTVYEQTPSELLDIFCDDVFNKTTTVLLVICYQSDTRVTMDYIYDAALTLGYPVIMWDPLYKGSIEVYSERRMLQLATTIYHDCAAVFKILEHYNWTEFAVVSTERLAVDFIQCLDEMVKKTSVQQGYLSIARFKKIATVILDTSEWEYGYANEEQKAVAIEEMTKLRAQSRIIILHADSFSGLTIGEIAEEMQLTGPGYGWIVTSQGSPENMNRNTKYPVGFLAISQNRSMEVVQEAINTALKFLTRGLEQMYRDGILRGTDLQPDYSCDSTNLTKWTDGSILYDYIKSTVVQENTMDISFTDRGIIEFLEQNIYNVRPRLDPRRRRIVHSFHMVGRVFPVMVDNQPDLKMEMNDIMWPGGGRVAPLGRPERRFFRLVTKEEPPFIIYVAPDAEGKCGHYAVECYVNGASLPGNTSTNGTVRYCCTGLCIEVLQILADKMRFDFHLYDIPDGQWGVKDNATGEWTGLVKEVLDERADMILTAFIMNQIRNTAIDFSVPFLESGITIMVSIRKGAISPYAFLEPYDFYSWILILIFSVHATGASIFIFEWFSPSGLAQGETSTVEHKFSLFRSFWLIWAMLFGAAVSIDVPRGVSSRFLANVWALFALVFLASYTANLAAFMITIDEFYDLSGIEDWRLLNPTKLTPHFKFATIANSSTDVNLQFNYRKMHNYMNKYTQPDVQTAKEALKNQSIHAFIYDANVLEYTAGRDESCSLLTVGRWYAMSGYGIGLRKGSDLKPEVDKILLNLIYNGEIERLQAFWLSGACHAKKDKKNKSNNKIGILNFISAFILLAAGVLLGVLLLALEHLYFKSGRKCLKKYDKCGCCELVSLSMGKSLTFEQSVFTAIDINKKHKCKDPICEMHLWKARHQLDMALIKMKSLQEQLEQTSTCPAIEEQASLI